MGSPRKSALRPLEPLEARDVPASGPLADLNTTGAPAFPPLGALEPSGAAVGPAVYFTATDAAGVNGLWRSDGTAGGTTRVADVTPQVTSVGLPDPLDALFPAARPVAAVNGKLVFPHADRATGAEPWVSDGTAAGTRRLADLAPGAESSGPRQFQLLGNRLLFTATVQSPGLAVPADVLFSTDGTPAGTVRLAAVNSAPGTGVAAVGGKAYFVATAYDQTTFQATSTIWATDGTPAGTRPFAALPDGVTVADTALAAGVPWAAGTGTTLVFPATDSTAGTELWVSDGTPAGTHRLKDINTLDSSPGYNPFPWPPDLPPLPPLPNQSSSPARFTAVGGTVYFTADDGLRGPQLWKTDGTEVGTVALTSLPGWAIDAPPGADEYPVPPPTKPRVTNLTAVGGRLYFAAGDGAHGTQLYVTDGTAAGTAELSAVGHTPDSDAGFPGEDPEVLAVVGGKVLFSIADAAHGRQLWATDGTAAGTALVKPIGDPANPLARLLTGPVALGVAGGRLLFTADDGVSGRQLWATDGTAAGTSLVKRINTSDLGSNPAGFVAVGGKAFFTASDGLGRAAVYATDGTAAPVAVKRFDTAFTLGSVQAVGSLTASGGKAYFVARSGTVGLSLWASDGTASGTRLVKQVAAPDPQYGYAISNKMLGIDNPTDVNGTLYFTIDLPGSGQELWKTDGTAGGTVRVRQVSPKSAAEAPILGTPEVPTWGPIRQLTSVGGRLFFAAGDGTAGEELWVSDGTAAGTKQVKDINPAGTGADRGSHPSDLVALSGKLYFTANDGTAGRQLWVSDGTAAGTKQVAVINQDNPTDPLPIRSVYAPTAPETRNMAAAGGKLFVVGFDPAHGAQLWVSDGTAAGTRRLTDTGVTVAYLPRNAEVARLTPAGDRLYFVAADPATGRQLWVSDGTPAGTRAVKPVGVLKETFNPSGGPPLPGGAEPGIMAVVGNRVLFSADDGATGRELWVSDGTAGGTRLLREFNPGPRDGLPSPVVEPQTAAVVNGRAVFAATDADHGSEPWSIATSEFLPAPPPPVPTPTPTPAPTPGPGKASVVRTSAASATEGTGVTATLATVRLPAGPAYKAWVFWGDGRTAEAIITRVGTTGDTFTLSASHTYDRPGNFAVMIRVTANTRTVLSIDTTAAVADARWYAGRVAQRFAAGQAFSGVVATIQDLNPLGKASDYTAAIDWGDGKASAGTVRRTAAGRFEVVADHTFAAAGRPAVRVTITSVGSGKAATAEPVFIIDAARLPAAGGAAR